MTFGNAFDLDLDRQGRVLLPLPLRSYAGIEEDVVVVGTGDYLEMWNSTRWTSEIARVEESAWQMAETAEEKR